MDSTVLFRAGEKIGKPTLAGIWLRTKPAPWYTRFVGPGSIPVFLFIGVFAAFRFLFPLPRTDTEALLNHSGEIYCVQTTNDFVFIASCKHTRELTDILQCYSSSRLTAFDYDDCNTTAVNFEFKSLECIELHFEGDYRKLAEFFSETGSQSTRSIETDR